MISKKETLDKINISLPSYVSEKIRYASDSVFQEKNEILVKIKKMRKIAQDIYYDARYSSVDYFKIRNLIFVEQAKFMVDVEDHYEQNVFPDYSYFWNYESLEVPELRTYFTWRSKIRKKEYPKISTSYILIYFSELINLIGVSNEKEAFDQIVELINIYYNDVPEIYFQRVFQTIPRDFIINYGLSVHELEKLTINTTNDLNYQVMLKIYQKDYTNILKYLSIHSSYKIMNSQFYQTKYGFLIEAVIPTVFESLDIYFATKKLDFGALVLGEKVLNTHYRLFQSLAYYETRESFTSNIVFSEIEEYKFLNGDCFAYMYQPSPNIRIILGIILKQIEARLREKTGYKRKIRVNLNEINKLPIRIPKLIKILDEEFLNVINCAVDQVLIEKQKDIKKEFYNKRKSEIIIDPSTFDSIRESTFRVQEKLVTEEEKIEELDVFEDMGNQNIKEMPKIESIPEQESVVEMGMGRLLKSFTSLELEIVGNVIAHLSRRELEDIAKKNLLLLEVVIENINLKALDYIGDNLIEDLIDEVCIYEDYIEELKEGIQDMEV